MPQRTFTPEERARRRAKARTDMLWHIGAFVIINGFFWLLDWLTGATGIQWAYWITIFWGFALAFHLLTYLVRDRGGEGRVYERALAEERRRETQRG